jgi:hypothetical protein
MKDWLSVQDYLFDVRDVGDWEGEEELVADRINAIYHAVWPTIPEDASVALIDRLMRDIWDQLRGSEVMIEADEDELVDWALAHSRQFIEQQGAPSDDEDDEDADDDAEDVIDEEEY